MNIPGGENKFRRVLLKSSKPRLGSFSQLLGESFIELIQVLNREPKKIFENRWLEGRPRCKSAIRCFHCFDNDRLRYSGDGLPW